MGFDLGLEIAIKYQAKLVLLNVLPTLEFEAMLERNEDYPVDELQHLCREAISKGVNCQYRTDVGEEVSRITVVAGQTVGQGTT